MKGVIGIIFHAPQGASRWERLVENGRWAAALGLAKRLRAAGVTGVHVVTPDAARCPGGEGEVDFVSSQESGFHFGRALQDVISDKGPHGFLYFGSGAGGLLSEGELRHLAEFAARPTTAALFNNFYSCDFCAVANASHLLELSLPAIDNPLGFALSDAGVPCFQLPRTAATQFDIDTPSDLLLLVRGESGTPELRSFCAALDPRHPTLDRALAALTDRDATTCLVGRVNPGAWNHFESLVACKTSALSEGRGMRAGASSHIPWVRQVLRGEGPDVFFDRLAKACDSAWIDTRPLLAGGSRLASAADRFASDVLSSSDITDPLWHAFTTAASEASIPVVLGGHSLVSGGLYLAAEACWKGSNLVRRLHPDPYP